MLDMKNQPHWAEAKCEIWPFFMCIKINFHCAHTTIQSVSREYKMAHHLHYPHLSREQSRSAAAKSSPISLILEGEDPSASRKNLERKKLISRLRIERLPTAAEDPVWQFDEYRMTRSWPQIKHAKKTFRDNSGLQGDWLPRRKERIIYCTEGANTAPGYLAPKVWKKASSHWKSISW